MDINEFAINLLILLCLLQCTSIWSTSATRRVWFGRRRGTLWLPGASCSNCCFTSTIWSTNFRIRSCPSQVIAPKNPNYCTFSQKKNNPLSPQQILRARDLPAQHHSRLRSWLRWEFHWKNGLCDGLGETLRRLVW